MLSINTNLSSLIAQNSMKTSTDKLNQAIERMSTGFKINHAKDNAANYSISTNMSTKIGAYNVAEDNATMGLDMLTTAQDNIAQMQTLAERLRSLAVQARNGTYGATSLNALQNEADSIISEINRLHKTTKYNGVDLLEEENVISTSLPTPKAKYNNFIENPFDYTESEVAAMTTLASIDENTTLTEGKYSISTDDDLAKLARMVEAGKIQGSGANLEFVLGADIDLKDYSAGEGWDPIGNSTNIFNATFNGNGHKITNLVINRPNEDFQGLFCKTGQRCVIKNLAIIDTKIEGGSWTGALTGSMTSGLGPIITNCYTTGEVKGKAGTGSLAGRCDSKVENCYSTCNVIGSGHGHGGLIGEAYGDINNCFFSGNLKGGLYVGGLVGYSHVRNYTSCYVTGDITGSSDVGGVVGISQGTTTIKDCYVSGDIKAVSPTGSVGGFIGSSNASCKLVNTRLSGNIFGATKGDLVGRFCLTTDDINFRKVEVQNCDINQNNDLIGYIHKNISGTTTKILDFDFSEMQKGLISKKQLSLQIGINGSKNSTIDFNSRFDYELVDKLESINIKEDSLILIDEFINLLNKKEVELGAVQNRLESVLEEISVQYDNLVSSRSTLRDADIAEVSSHYIQQQILQQASATLMATANQSPSIALQLI